MARSPPPGPEVCNVLWACATVGHYDVALAEAMADTLYGRWAGLVRGDGAVWGEREGAQE